MATEAQTQKTEQQQAPPGAQPGGEPPKAEAKTPPAPEPAKPAPAQLQNGEQAKPADRVPTRKLLGDEDDIPDDADLIEMSPRKLKARLERHTKKQLRDRFGSDDPDAIKARLDKLAQFEEDQEKQRQAQLTETEKMKEQLAAAEKRAVDAEARVQKAHLQRVVEHEDRRAQRILAKYVDEDDVDDVVPKLARFVNGLTDAELANPDKVIEDWAKDFIEKKPKFAKASIKEERERVAKAEADKAAKEAEAAKSKVKVPLSTGPAGGKPGQQVDTGGPKTAAPGRPNSMTDAEWRDYKRQSGIQY